MHGRGGLLPHSFSGLVLPIDEQTALNASSSIGIRIIAILVYWFGYLMFMRFYWYTKALRRYMLELEAENRTSIAFHTALAKGKKSRVTASKLLAIFGLIYTVILLVLLLL